MLIVISPAKSLDTETPAGYSNFTLPEMTEQSEKLVKRLKNMSPKQLSALMGISAELGELNFKRFQQWQLPFTSENAKQALFIFNGDVYQGLQAKTLPAELLELAQTRLRILSGLYGVLRPLDLMQPYRLEMGTRLKYQRADNLYEFWKPAITKKINEAVAQSGSGVLVNLASNEYFKSIDLKKLKAKVVTPEFRELKNGKYVMVSFFAKRARGLMTRFVLENNITNPAELEAFDVEGYVFDPRLSKPENPVFTRES